MAQCMTFYKAFKDNMEALGLPAPVSLFGAQQSATATLAAILSALKSLGAEATIGELIGATTRLEALAVVSALSASFYAGAVIGSLMVAAGASMSCSNPVAAVSDVRTWAARSGVSIPRSVYQTLAHNPRALSGIRTHAFRVRAAGSAKAAA